MAHHAKGVGVRRAVAGVLLAGASFFAFSATAAHAGQPARTTGSVVQAEDCFTPDFVPWDHTKACGAGWAFVNYDYKYTYSPNQSTLYCHVFDASYFGCGGWSDIGERTRCGFV